MESDKDAVMSPADKAAADAEAAILQVIMTASAATPLATMAPPIQELTLVKKLRDNSSLLCPVCLDILEDPHRVNSCGHVFCHGCVRGLKACPLDRKTIEPSALQQDRMVRSLIDELDVHCPHRKHQCKWTGEYVTLMSHLQECPHAPHQSAMMSSGGGAAGGGSGGVDPVVRRLWTALEESKQREAVMLARLTRLEETVNKHLLGKNVTAAALATPTAHKSPSVSGSGGGGGGVTASASGSEDKSAMPELTLKQVMDLIDETIGGAAGGAHIYDAGEYQACHQLYLGCAWQIIARTPITQQGEFWYRILVRAVTLSTSAEATQNRTYGHTSDGAWIMRFAFEAVRKGCFAKGVGRDIGFWNRRQDRFGFVELLD
eukprot:TRINITY_DN374_c0_g1_i1.p1 TRINITY_DN374_c0_g1~~TRINITY_DN374_c0_g1_i1.p1  ORF type:complete len:421 (+),score=84.19 TRINITY_DN374_c0_g1_i1:139-1263(+)